MCVCGIFFACVYDWRSGLPCFHADTATLITFSKTLRSLMAFPPPPPCRHLSLFSVLLSPHLLCLLFTSVLTDFWFLSFISFYFHCFPSSSLSVFHRFLPSILTSASPPPASTEQTTTVTVSTLMAFFKAFTQWTPKEYFSNC